MIEILKYAVPLAILAALGYFAYQRIVSKKRTDVPDLITNVPDLGTGMPNEGKPIKPEELSHLAAPSTRVHISAKAEPSPMRVVKMEGLMLHSPTPVVLKAGKPANLDFNFTGWVEFGCYENPGTDRTARVTYQVGDKVQAMALAGKMEVNCTGPGTLSVVSNKDTSVDVVPKRGKPIDLGAKTQANKEQRAKNESKTRKG